MIENTMGQALKKGLKEEIYRVSNFENLMAVAVQLLLKRFISPATAVLLKEQYLTGVAFAEVDLQDYEESITRMIVTDSDFCGRFGTVAEIEKLFFLLDVFKTNPNNISESWFNFLYHKLPNVVAENGYVYCADRESGLCRIAVEHLKDEETSDDCIEKLPGLSHIIDIAGRDDYYLFLKDGERKNVYYRYYLREGKLKECKGNLLGVTNGIPIVERDGMVLLDCTDDEYVLLIKPGVYPNVMVHPIGVIVNYNYNEKVKAIPFKLSIGGKRELTKDDEYRLWFDYVVRRLFSDRAGTSKPYSFKMSRSVTASGSCYADCNAPYPIDAVHISKKIRDIMAHCPDDKNTRLFLEMLMYADKQMDQDVPIYRRMWQLMIEDTYPKENTGVFSAMFCEEHIGKKVFIPRYDKK